jgi:uncharacterized membrane protein YvbJ
MVCRNCGKALPNKGNTCKFCGALMNEEELKLMRNNTTKEQKRIELLSEKYGQERKIDYREKEENKPLGMAVIIIILLFLIVMTILINVIKG